MRRLLPGLVVVLLGAVPAAADEPAKPKITFDEHVKPIFREHCLSCHNSSKATNDLALDSYARVMQGGASGEAVAAGDPDGSYLWLLVSHESEPVMPPAQDKLVAEKLNLIREWILGGAPENAGSKVAVKPKNKIEMASGGAERPEGPPCIPEGLRKEPFVHTKRAGAVTALTAAPWAPVAAIAGQKQIVLANSDSGDLLGVVPFDEGIPHVLKFSRSGTLLLAGGGHAAQMGKAVVYDVKTGNRLFDVGDELDVVLGADLLVDHTRIALGGPQRVLRVYNTADGSLLHEVSKHTDWIYSVGYSPDGVLLASGDRSGGLFVWEAQSMNEYLNLQGHKAGVTSVSWRPDSNVLASASEDGTIKLWEMQNGNNIKTVNAHGGGVLAVQFAHDGRFVSAGRDRLVKVWDAGGNQQAQFGPMPELVLEVAITHDGKRVIAGDWSGQISVWNIDEKKEERQLTSNLPLPAQ